MTNKIKDFLPENVVSRFRIITPENREFVKVLYPEISLYEVDDFYGTLVDIGVCQDTEPYLSEIEREALNTLKKYPFQNVGELEIKDTAVLFVYGYPDVRVLDYELVNYLEPDGEGGTQVDDATWENIKDFVVEM